MKKVLTSPWAIFHVILYGLAGLFLLWIHQFALVGLRGFVQGDLGLLLNVPARILHGQIPFRDFYAGNYTPGSYYLHALLFCLFGEKASVLTTALACSQILALFFFYRLAARAWGSTIAAFLSGIALILAVPTTPIPFPAIYCVLFALMALFFAQKFFDDRRDFWLVLCGAVAGLAIAFKLSTGIFLTAALVLYLLHGFRWRMLLKITATLCLLGAAYLIRERVYVATFLLFILPLLMLVLLVWKKSAPEAGFELLSRRQGFLALLAFGAPLVLINLVWLLPFLKMLGPEKLFYHFISFPALQPKVLFYPAPLPISLNWSEKFRAFGFEGIRDYKSLWKMWFYLPCIMSIAAFVRVRKSPVSPIYFAFFAYNALLPLQIFPTIDYLHFAWSAQGALLLTPLLLVEKKKARLFQAGLTKWILTGLLFCQLLYYADYVGRKKMWRGFQKPSSPHLDLFFPRSQAVALDTITEDLHARLVQGAWFWNPPGSLLNFSLGTATPLSSDYWGPPYWSAAEQEAQLLELKKNPPAIVVVPLVDEAYFGWAAFQLNYPKLAAYIESHYAKTEEISEFLRFERNLVTE